MTTALPPDSPESVPAGQKTGISGNNHAVNTEPAFIIQRHLNHRSKKRAGLFMHGYTAAPVFPQWRIPACHKSGFVKDCPQS